MPFFFMVLFNLQLFPFFSVLNHIIIAALIGLIYFSKLYQIRAKENIQLFMYCGTALGLLQIFSPSTIVLFPVVVITIFSFDNLKRDGVFAFLSFYMMVTVSTLAVMFLIDNLDDYQRLLPKFDLLHQGFFELISSWNFLIFWPIIILVLLLTFVFSGQLKFRIRNARLKDVRVNFFILVYIMVFVFFVEDKQLSLVSLIAVPASILLTYAFHLSRYTKLMHILFLFITLGFVLSYLAPERIFEFFETLT